MEYYNAGVYEKRAVFYRKSERYFHSQRKLYCLS